MKSSVLSSPLSRSDGGVPRRGEGAARRSRAERLSPAALIGLAAILIANPAAAQKVGATAPALIGQTIDGKPFDLAKLRGHVVVANVWATWCTPCRVEMPTLEAFYKAHKAQGVVLVGLSADRPRDAATVDRVMSAFTYPAVIMKNANTNGFTPPNILPVTYIIDANGIVRSALLYTDKPLSEADLTAALASAQRK